MIYIFFEIIVIFLSIIGLTELSRMILYYFHKIDDEPVFIAVRLGCETENIEMLLKSVAVRVSWLKSGKNVTVLCVDCGLSDEQKKIAEALCLDYSYMILLTPEEAAGYLS